MLPPRSVACQARSIASGVGAYRGSGRGAVRTKSSPTGPAEHDEGGSLSTKCQHHGFCMSEVFLFPLICSAKFVRIVDTARLRVDVVLMFTADAPLRSRSSKQTPHLAACDEGWREEREDEGQGIYGQDDIPAQVGEFLVDSLQRHFVWLLRLWMCGGWFVLGGWLV